MTFDFSNLYRTQTVTIGIQDKDLFTVTVREIPHGDFLQLQKETIGETRIPKNKRDADRMLENIKFSAPDMQDRRMLLGIQEWTLKDAKGVDVPVCMEAWRALPHVITEQIEKAVNGLNPDLDEEFQGESGD